MFNKKAEISLLMLAIIGVVALLVGAGAIYFYQNGTPQDVYVTYSLEEEALQDAMINAPAITFNNITLFDSTQINLTSNTCSGSRYGMSILINPCIAQDVDGKDVVQYVNFTWNGGSSQDTDWVFIYDGILERGKMDAWLPQTVYWNESVAQNAWLNNHQIANVVGFANLGTPDNRCELGNQNNTQMFNVTRNLVNGTVLSQVYCFTSAVNQGGGTYALSGNYNQFVDVTKSKVEYDWRDISGQIEYMGYGLLNDERSYYKAQDVEFAPGQTVATRWTYTAQENSKRGKWHILGYDSSVGLVQSIVNDQYIYIDPWWNNNWEKKKLITNLSGNIITLRFPYDSDMQSNFADVRFIDNATESIELPYARIQFNATTATYKVQTNGSTSVYMYYDNPLASYTGNIVGVYHPNLLGAWFFDENYINSVNGFNATANNSMWIENGQNESFKWANASDSANTYIRAGTFTSPSEYTFVSKMRLNSGENQASVMSFTDTSYSNKHLYLETDGSLYHVVGTGGANAYPTLSFSNDGQWHTFVGTAKAGGNILIYKDSSASSASTGIATFGTSNTSFTLGGSFNNANSYGGRQWGGAMDYALYLDKQINASDVDWIINQKAPYAIYGAEQVSSGLSLALGYPADAQLFNTLGITFNATLTPTSINNTNATITVWNASSSVIFTQINIVLGNTTNTTNWSNTFTQDGVYTWNVVGCGSDGVTSQCSYDVNRTFTIDTTAPSLSILQPSNYQFFITPTFPYNVLLNSTASDLNLGSCWYRTSENATNTTFTCNALTNVTFNSFGNKTIFVTANDSLGSTITGNVSIAIATYSQSQSTTSIAEGSTATFTLAVNMTDIPATSAYFRYNNTNYAPATQSNTQNATVFTYDLDIPAGYGNQSGISQYWNWTFNITGFVTNYNTTTQTQSVFTVDFDNCELYPVLAYNLTLYDEETRELVNASAGANIQVDLTWIANSGVQFTKSFENNNNHTMLICVPANILNGTEFSVDLTAEYSSTDRVTEFYYMDNGTISNNTIPEEIYLYDLNLADSTTFLFTFLDENGLETPGVIVETLRYYIGSGEFIEVERSKEDNNGQTHIHLVEEDVIYKFRVTLENQEIFESQQYNAKCLSSPCSITLSAQPDNDPFPTIYNNLPEGSYAISADKDTRQVTLSFNLNATETMNLSIYTQNNNEVELVAQGTTTASSGSVVVNVPVQYGNATYSAVVYMGEDFVGTRVVDLSEDANDYFGALGLLLGALAVLCLALIGASHGEWVIVWTVLGMITASTLFLVDLEWYALLTFIAGAGIFLIKLVSRRRVS